MGKYFAIYICWIIMRRFCEWTLRIVHASKFLNHFLFRLESFSQSIPYLTFFLFKYLCVFLRFNCFLIIFSFCNFRIIVMIKIYNVLIVYLVEIYLGSFLLFSDHHKGVLIIFYLFFLVMINNFIEMFFVLHWAHISVSLIIITLLNIYINRPLQPWTDFIQFLLIVVFYFRDHLFELFFCIGSFTLLLMHLLNELLSIPHIINPVIWLFFFSPQFENPICYWVCLIERDFLI